MAIVFLIILRRKIKTARAKIFLIASSCLQRVYHLLPKNKIVESHNMYVDRGLAEEFFQMHFSGPRKILFWKAN